MSVEFPVESPNGRRLAWVVYFDWNVYLMLYKKPRQTSIAHVNKAIDFNCVINIINSQQIN